MGGSRSATGRQPRSQEEPGSSRRRTKRTTNQRSSVSLRCTSMAAAFRVVVLLLHARLLGGFTSTYSRRRIRAPPFPDDVASRDGLSSDFNCQANGRKRSSLLLASFALPSPSDPCLDPPPVLYPLLCLDHGLLRSGLAFTSTGIGFDDLCIIRHNSTGDFQDIDDDIVEDKDDAGEVGGRNGDTDDELDFIIAGALAEASGNLEEDVIVASASRSEQATSAPTSPLTLSLLKYARLLKVRTVVVGLPLFKDGSESRQSRIVRRYCESDLKWSLVREFGGEFAGNGSGANGAVASQFEPAVRVYLFDERYSSSEAAALMSTSSAGSRPVTRDLDAVSACVVLSHFCKVNGLGGEEVTFREEEMGRIGAVLEAYEEGEDERRLDSERKKRVSTLKESRQEMISRLENASTGGKKKKKNVKKRARWTKIEP